MTGVWWLSPHSVLHARTLGVLWPQQSKRFSFEHSSSRERWRRGASHLFDQPTRDRRERRNPLAEWGEARVVGLAADVAGVDLLDDYRELEHREDFVQRDLLEIAAGARGVALEDLLAAVPAGPRRHRADGRVVHRRDMHPVREQESDVDQRIADGAHLPVEDADHALRLFGVEHDVVEFVV